MTATILPTAAVRRAIQAAYEAGRNAPADEDAAVMALAEFCRTNGYQPGDPFADAWTMGWHDARRAEASGPAA